MRPTTSLTLFRRLRIFPLLACLALLSCSPPETAVTEAAKPAAGAKSDEAQAEPKLAPKLETLPAEELAEGWISLFDGETFFGWKPECKADWKIKDGSIVVTEGEVGLLCTTTQFADYVLRVDYRNPAGTNSGVFLRSAAVPKNPAEDCYELNIADPDNPFPTGSLVARKKVEVESANDTWHTFEVTCQGARVAVMLDGKEVVDYQDEKPLGRGIIGLQHNKGKVEFRNVKLKPLGLASLFNGKDLSGWKEYPKMASKFTVAKEGELNVTNGKGQLETEKTFGDFAMQLECFSHARHLNSGLFFRCIPGDEMMGYECQIHNGYKDGDRTKPVDCGTGGIFRRQNARLVASDDLEWLHLTLVADGPHMAAWVNGHQVSDWTDDRPADANPRKGLRLEPGTLMLQGHDPTTNLSFRNLRAGEMPK